MNEEIVQIKSFVKEFLKQVLSSGEEPPEEIKILVEKVLQRAMEKVSEIESRNINGPPPQEPISPDAQLLWVLAGQQEQAFISYLRTFPTPQTQSLLNNPTALSHTIQQLNRMMPQGEPPVIDGIQHADLNSSNIWGTQYNPKTGKMKVRFQGGSEYEYDGVPQNIYRAFSKGNASARTKGRNEYGEWWPNKNPSLGAAMNQYIKAGNFPYRKIK